LEKALKIFGKENRDKIYENTLKVHYSDFYLEISKDLLNREKFKNLFDYITILRIIKEVIKWLFYYLFNVILSSKKHKKHSKYF